MFVQQQCYKKIIMKTWWKQILFEWNICRIVRIAAGIAVLIVGVNNADWPVMLFGVGFLAAGLFSVYCCAAGACYVPQAKKPLHNNSNESR
jgi:hypothetical protein